MRWFHFTIQDFEESINPPNCGLVVIERKRDEEVRPRVALEVLSWPWGRSFGGAS